MVSETESSFKDRVLLCTTDGAANMKKAMKVLKKGDYKKMIHITCLDHALHNISKKIMDFYEDVNELVFAVFKAGGKKLPSFPVITRYGSCLKSVSWYTDDENFNHAIVSVKEIRKAAEGKQNAPLRMKCDTILGLMTPNMREDVKFIHNTFAFIVDSIVKLESRSINLTDSIKIFEEVHEKLSQSEIVPDDIKEKVTNLRAANCGYKDLIVYKKDQVLSKELLLWHEDELPLLENAIVTSTEIERVFSVYNTMFRSNRRSFNFENFAKYVMSKWYLQIVRTIMKLNHLF